MASFYYQTPATSFNQQFAPLPRPLPIRFETIQSCEPVSGQNWTLNERILPPVIQDHWATISGTNQRPILRYIQRMDGGGPIPTLGELGYAPAQVSQPAVQVQYTGTIPQQVAPAPTNVPFSWMPNAAPQQQAFPFGANSYGAWPVQHQQAHAAPQYHHYVVNSGAQLYNFQPHDNAARPWNLGGFNIHNGQAALQNNLGTFQAPIDLTKETTDSLDGVSSPPLAYTPEPTPAPKPRIPKAPCHLKERMKHVSTRVKATTPQFRWFKSFIESSVQGSEKKAYCAEHWTSDEKAWEDVQYAAYHFVDFNTSRLWSKRWTWNSGNPPLNKDGMPMSHDEFMEARKAEEGKAIRAKEEILERERLELLGLGTKKRKRYVSELPPPPPKKQNKGRKRRQACKESVRPEQLLEESSELDQLPAARPRPRPRPRPRRHRRRNSHIYLCRAQAELPLSS